MTLLFEVKFGSQVYGTSTPDSDIDIGRVLLEPRQFIYGIQHLSNKSNTIAQTVEGETDTKEMYLRRFVMLCAQGNPNTLEWLYTPANHITYIDERFKRYIWDNVGILLNKDKLVASHLGFAKSQVIRMRQHESKMGAKRKKLYAQYGYDVKFANHAMRLMFQLRDLLKTGSIILPYGEVETEMMVRIKTGQWTLEQFDEFYANYHACIKGMINNWDSPLPAETNYDKIAETLESFYMEAYHPGVNF